MLEVQHSVDDVFGVSRDVPLNYVDRETVDGKFIQSLTRSHHIVIFGSSKQGKTCLRKHCLNEDDYIAVACHNSCKRCLRPTFYSAPADARPAPVSE